MRTNSKISLKCKCGCDRLPTLSCYGFNYNCLSAELAEKAGTRKQVQKRNYDASVTLSRQLHMAQKKVDHKVDDYNSRLDLWFKYQMTVNKKICSNCGASLEHYSENDWKGSQHHIVDKALCPSVAAHPQNHLVLGRWCMCHNQWHTSFDNSSKMKVFPLAKEKFKLFKNDIAEDELSKVNPYLWGVLNPY